MAAESPGAFGVDLAAQGEVDVVVDGEVVSAVAQVESLVVVFAERREDDAARILFGEWEIAERQGQREGHVGEHHVSGAGHDILVGAHLGARQLEVEVGMLVVVAGGVLDRKSVV